jgi:hypothetical protein
MHDLASAHVREHYCMKERGFAYPDVNLGCSPYLFKKIRQMTDFDKRVIWTEDKSFEELSKECFDSFVDSQKRFVCPEPMSQRATLVITEAQKICARILGKFDYDLWFDSCSFGKRAAVGLPRRESYLDERFNRLSGTSMQIAAFKHMLSRDVHLFRAVRKRVRVIQSVDTIKATAVPKSWKAARIIAPDTILGGLLSRGLGDLIRKRLEKNTHIDLSQQQERHRRWAQVASKTGYLSTIDMSKASDSFVWRHLELLVPKDWHHALDVVRTRNCEVPGHSDPVQLGSYMLMGSGHTFPLQTLLFYSLAEATRTLLKCRGKVSVYGDDIIVPTRMVIPFIVIMSELGFTINSEKSFFDKPDKDRPSHTFFRESCGGDYKGGVDVRPYMPECNLQDEGRVPRNEFIAWCHKMVNGLLNRWSIEEIPQTVLFLFKEINNRKRAVCLVPPWETDHAGIKHHIPPYYRYGIDLCDVKYARSVPVYWRLTFKMKKRARKLEEQPYKWYAYWLMRNKSRLSASDLPVLTRKGEKMDLYSPAIELNGESLKSDKGKFQWEPVLCCSEPSGKACRTTLVQR